MLVVYKPLDKEEFAVLGSDVRVLARSDPAARLQEAGHFVTGKTFNLYNRFGFDGTRFNLHRFGGLGPGGFGAFSLSHRFYPFKESAPLLLPVRRWCRLPHTT
jgi:hypothetical protein